MIQVTEKLFPFVFFFFNNSKQGFFILVQSHKPLQSSQWDTDAGQISLSCLQLFCTKSSVVLQTLFSLKKTDFGEDLSSVGWDENCTPITECFYQFPCGTG